MEIQSDAPKSPHKPMIKENPILKQKQPNQNKKNQNPNQNQSKKKQTGPKLPTQIPKRDHYQRLTYLYKIGTILSTKQVTESRSQQENASINSFEIISRSCLRNMDLVSKKSVLKLHPNIKRTICKSCSRLQIPSQCEIRLTNNSKQKLSTCDSIELKCNCGKLKRFPIGKDPEYTLFADREDVAFDSVSSSDNSSKNKT